MVDGRVSTCRSYGTKVSRLGIASTDMPALRAFLPERKNKANAKCEIENFKCAPYEKSRRPTQGLHLKRKPQSLMSVVIAKIKDGVVTLLVTTVIAMLTVFSDKIIGCGKQAINRADLRVAQYEKICSQISVFTTYAEWVNEFYENGWTDKTSLHAVVDPYNSAIENIRKDEYVNIGMLYRFWSEKQVTEFKSIMATVRKIDSEIHLTNSEATLVEKGEKTKADPAVIKPITDRLRPLNKQLQEQVDAFLSNLLL